ncbi:MAG: hypothetical protein V7L02_22210 [Nostoc sp.]
MAVVLKGQGWAQGALRKLWRQYTVGYGCCPNPTNDWVEAKKTLHRMHWRLRKPSTKLV